MEKHTLVRVCLLLLFGGLVIALIAACGPVSDVIGDREQPTPTSRSFTTATPGGQLSVWLVTPTGQSFAQPTPTPGTVGGNPVGPNATATALIATIEAATATAAAPLPAPYSARQECPAPGAPAPPTQPASFSDYSVMIGRYLSGGGSPTVLEATLRNWGAITERGGVVQADTDITGDGTLEVIVTIFDPAIYNAEAPLNAGEMMVFGCDSGGYRLLYKTQYNAGLAIPELVRVGDMNTDVKNELVYFIESCNRSGCYKDAKILTWNTFVGAFEELNSGQIVAVNGRVGVADIDEDGVLELTAYINPPGDLSSGPSRSLVDIWDWNGQDYVLAVREEPEGSFYHIHAIYDADDLFRAGEYRNALMEYDAVRRNPNLLNWTTSGERDFLDAYAAYQIVIGFARLGSGRADSWLPILVNQNPPGSPGYGFAQMGQVFMDNYRATGDTRAACAEARSAGLATNVLSLMNSYGFNNRSYTMTDLCPF